MFSAQAPSFTRSNHRHSTVAGREQIIQARFSAENEHVCYGATCSSNREFVLHCQVRYEANSIDPKSRFKLRSAKIAPILGYIARPARVSRKSWPRLCPSKFTEPGVRCSAR